MLPLQGKSLTTRIHVMNQAKRLQSLEEEMTRANEEYIAAVARASQSLYLVSHPLACIASLLTISVFPQRRSTHKSMMSSRTCSPKTNSPLRSTGWDEDRKRPIHSGHETHSPRRRQMGATPNTAYHRQFLDVKSSTRPPLESDIPLHSTTMSSRYTA